MVMGWCKDDLGGVTFASMLRIHLGILTVIGEA